jgi:hypothetical protein
MKQNLSLLLIIILLTTGLSAASAGERPLPPDGGYVNVQTDFGAKGDGRTDDTEAMWTIGSLAARLVDLYKVRTWTQFKAKLSAEAYDRLLKDFEEEGNAFHRDGKDKAAYAVQLLAVSVILLGKPNQCTEANMRPIGLLPMINRLWVASRQHALQASAGN